MEMGQEEEEVGKRIRQGEEREEGELGKEAGKEEEDKKEKQGIQNLT